MREETGVVEGCDIFSTAEPQHRVWVATSEYYSARAYILTCIILDLLKYISITTSVYIGLSYRTGEVVLGIT